MASRVSAAARYLVDAFPTEGPKRYAAFWVAFGAVSGGTFSGCRKLDQVSREPTPEYTRPEVEVPIRAVYHASRIAAHAGWGATIGGAAAATAPPVDDSDCAE